MLPFESFSTVSHSVPTMAVSLAVLTYSITNVTDRHPARHRTTTYAEFMRSIARKKTQLCVIYMSYMQGYVCAFSVV